MTHLHVRVTPRASRDAIEGFDDAGVLHIRVTAPPAEGAANKAVMKLLASALGVPPRDVVLVSGASSRLKVFEVEQPGTRRGLRSKSPLGRPREYEVRDGSG